MAYMVRWGPKGFLVSPSKVVPFGNVHNFYEAQK